MKTDKIILDACCGSRMMWFDKNNPLAMFTDIRNEEHTLCDSRKLEIKPDTIADFRNMPFESKSFKLVVLDPPHLKKLGPNSWMALKYGVLNETWQCDLKQGFDESMRVLDDYGVLIFKWNERDVKVSQLIEIFGQKPLFGHTSRRNSETIWMCFMKVPTN